jgi:hypothetical protein
MGRGVRGRHIFFSKHFGREGQNDIFAVPFGKRKEKSEK